jgi:membrane-bound serine protease (ClpP class)
MWLLATLALLSGAVVWQRAARAQAPSASPSAAPSAVSSETPEPGKRASKMSVDTPGPFPIPKDLPDKPRFIVVELHQEVNLGMAAFVERVATELEENDVLVLDIKTFGGRVDAAVTIRDALLHTHDVGARAVVYINPRAISAGALISFAADVIVVSEGATMGAATPVQIGQDQEMKPVGEKMVSYMRQEMRSTAEARGRNGDVAEAMVDADIEVVGLSDKGKLLTLDGKLALKWGVASFEAKNFDAVLEGLGYSDVGQYEVRHVKWSWAEDLAGWLSGSVIASLLMSIGMLAIMVGLYTGGNAVALTIGASCLALFFFGHHLVNLAGVEDIMVFVIGLSLLGFEVAYPGHIYPGVLGVMCIIGALIMGLIDFRGIEFSVQWEAGYIAGAMATVFGSVLLTAVGAFGIAKLVPKSAYGRRLLLTTAMDGRATDGLAVAENEARLIGARGTAVNDLHPAGKVKVDGDRYDARSEHGFIDRGSQIEVVKRAGFELIVANIEDEA